MAKYFKTSMVEKSAVRVLRTSSEQLKRALDNIETFHEQVLEAAVLLYTAFRRGGKVLIAGNGGSASEAQHFSDEMVGRYKSDRQPYPVVALTADSAVITCIGNDYGYEEVFKRQVEALGNQGDVFIGLSTSGTSKNIIEAAKAAQRKGMSIIALTGPKGMLKDMADVAIIAPTETGARMQEFHLHAIHLICELFEDVNILEVSKSEKVRARVK